MDRQAYLENPPYDQLFADEARRLHKRGIDDGKALHDTLTGHPYFTSLRYFSGFRSKASLQAFETIVAQINQQDPALCRQILIEQIINVGLKTTSRVAAENGITLNTDHVFEILPAWTTRLRRHQKGQSHDQGYLNDWEQGHGLKTRSPHFNGLVTDLIFSADKAVNKIRLKRYLERIELTQADIQALRLDVRYTPGVEKLWGQSAEMSQPHDLPNFLLSMAMGGTLDFDRLDAAVLAPDFKCTAIDLARMIGNRAAPDADAFGIVECLTNQFINEGRIRALVLEAALRKHVAALNTDQADDFCLKLLNNLLKKIPRISDPNEVCYVTLNRLEASIDGMAVLARTITQAAYQGASKAFVQMEKAASRPQKPNGHDQKTLLRIFKLGVFNMGATADLLDLKNLMHESVFQGLFEGVLVYNTRQAEDGVTEITTARYPRLDDSKMPRSLAKPMGDLVCSIISGRFKEGNNMTRRVLQRMVDLDVLEPRHILKIAAHEKGVQSLVRANLPQHLLEASEALMASKLESDLGL